MVKAGVFLVIQRIEVPMAKMPALVTTLARNPYCCIAHHNGITHTTYIMVPQLVMSATVDMPQPGKAAFMLSLMGPHVVHCRF